MTYQYEFIRQQMENIKSKYCRFDAQDEKICKNCLKSFFDKENMN